jgi:hypothetical protein
VLGAEELGQTYGLNNSSRLGEDRVAEKRLRGAVDG